MKKKNKILDFSRISTVAAIVKNVLKYKKSGTVLDLGTGTGRHALYLAKKGFRVTAIDRDPAKLFALKQNARGIGKRIIIQQSDIARFKPSKKYDVILATAVLHFLQKGQVSRAIKMMKLHTALHGINVVSVHTDKNPRLSRPYLFSEGELKKYYSNWKILQYRAGLGSPFRTKPRGKITRKYHAMIIAQKLWDV
jgi:tellurite methyltransferase